MIIGVAIGLFALGFILGIPFSRIARKRRRGGPADSIVTDPEALRKAEAELETESKRHWILVRTFNSIDGYSEQYMLDLVMKLQAEGLSVQYDSHISPGGNMRSYGLKTLVEEITAVQKAIQNL